MAHFGKDEVPMPSELRGQLSDECLHSNFRRLRSRTRSASISIPMVALEEQYEKGTSLADHTGPHRNVIKRPFVLLHQALYSGVKGFGRKVFCFCSSCVSRVMNPHAIVVQQWNKFLVSCCMMAIFVDPLFFFIIYVKKDDICIAINRSMTNILVSVRSVNDFAFFLNILLQFKLAYESRVVGVGDLVDHPKKIALNYLKGYFLIDLVVVFPVPQIVILFVLPNYVDSSGDHFPKNLLRIAILVQFFPRFLRFLNLLLSQSPTGFIFQSAGATFSINILILLICGHLVGSCWYLFGLQQISTLAGNQTPSYFVWEVVFTTTIIGLGLLFFAIQIGNILNFLQALGRRGLEMQLRGRDVEQWMHHRRFPDHLRRRVRQAERYNWAATRGVNEEMLLENLPEDLQIDIRRHLFQFVKKVRIFALMDEPILDTIHERLKQKRYIKGSKILSQGGLVEKMVFVVRGKLESIGEDGVGVTLSEGDACGEELLTWYLEHSSVSTDGKKVRLPRHKLLSNRTVRCLTNVEAFLLHAADLEEVAILYTRFLRSPQVQGTLRYESHYRRSLAAHRIRVAWRCRKKRLSRASTTQ